MKQKSPKKSVTLLLIGLSAALVLAVCLLVFMPPKAVVESITVIPGYTYWCGEKESSPDDAVAIIKAVFEMADNSEYQDIQLIAEIDELPSDDISDYSMAIFELDVTGRSLFEAHTPFPLVDRCENPEGIVLFTTAYSEEIEVERFSKEHVWIKIFLFTGGKTEEEISGVLKSIVFQFPYSNRVRRGSSYYSSCKHAEVIFDSDWSIELPETGTSDLPGNMSEGE